MVPKSIDSLELLERFKGYDNSLFAFFSSDPSPFHADNDGSKVEPLFLDCQGNVIVDSNIITVRHPIGRAFGVGVPFFPKEIEAASKLPFHERA